MSDLKALHIIPDVHVPFHDRRAWRLCLSVIQQRPPDTCVILGDFGDFYSVSSHARGPHRRALLLIDEVAAVNKALDDLQAVLPSHCRVIFCAGNHEDRLERYIAARAPDLFGTLRVSELFRLKDRGWKFVPYRSHVKVAGVYYTHEIGRAGANAHAAAERQFSSSCAIGHTHRMALTVTGREIGPPRVAGMFGWLGDSAAAEYMHAINATRDWTLGFGTGWMLREAVTFLQAHPIVNYKAVVDGALYAA